jgi:splicing factor 3A subunit 1
MQMKEAVIEMDESSDEEEDEQIKVVEEYAPKVVSSQAKFSSESMTHVIDPITKKSIPIADMTEHMRIQLLDPKWAAEKAKFMEKQKESNLVSGDAIARNMMTFAKARTDLFGTPVSFRCLLSLSLPHDRTNVVHFLLTAI